MTLLALRARAPRRGATLAPTLLVWAAIELPLAACPVCFQVTDGPEAAGIRTA